MARFDTKYGLKVGNSETELIFNLYENAEDIPLGCVGGIRNTVDYDISLEANEENDKQGISEVRITTNDDAGNVLVCRNLKCSHKFHRAFGMLVLKIEVTKNDGSKIKLRSGAIQVYLGKAEDEERISSIKGVIKALNSVQDTDVVGWMRPRQDKKRTELGVIKRGETPDREDNDLGSDGFTIEEFCRQCKNVIGVYEEKWSFFRTQPYTKIRSFPEMVDVDDVRSIGRKEVEWLANSPEVFYPVNAQTPLRIKGKCYVPSEVMTEKSKKSYDIYENQVIFAFIKK